MPEGETSVWDLAGFEGSMTTLNPRWNEIPENQFHTQSWTRRALSLCLDEEPGREAPLDEAVPCVVGASVCCMFVFKSLSI